jgi:hypothetical protein
MILTDHLLAFEVLSLLLLAAMVGAIVLARPRDYTAALAQAPETSAGTPGATSQQEKGAA